MKKREEKSPILPYLIPFLAYLLIPFLFDNIGLEQYSYPVKAIMTGLILIGFWKHYILKLKGNKWLLSILVGILVFLIWIAIEQFMPYSSDFQASTLNIAFRLFGGILIAPLIEELFTRSFLLRFLINPDKWSSIKPKFTLFSFAMTTAFFGFSHNRWLAGLIVGIILNLLYIKTKKIENCIIAHAVTNAILALYVILTNSWQFW